MIIFTCMAALILISDDDPARPDVMQPLFRPALNSMSTRVRSVLLNASALELLDQLGTVGMHEYPDLPIPSLPLIALLWRAA